MYHKSVSRWILIHNFLHITAVQTKQHNITGPQKPPCTCFVSLPPRVPPFSIWTPSINLPVFVQYGIIRFVLFWTWLLLPNIMLVYSPILPYVVVDFSFFLLYSIMWIHHNLIFLKFLVGISEFCNGNFRRATRNPSAQIYLYSELSVCVEIPYWNMPLTNTLAVSSLMGLILSCMSWLLFLLCLFSIAAFPWCLCQSYMELLSSFFLSVFHSG